ncbi:MAG: hypothetical protein ACI9LM_005367 [Alteromonadaceae bacterium]
MCAIRGGNQMDENGLPIVLVNTWLYIELSERTDLRDAKPHVHHLIEESFGSVDIAQKHIQTCNKKLYKSLY